MKPQVKLGVYDNGRKIRSVLVAPATAKRLTTQSPDSYKIESDDIGITVETKVIQKKTVSPADTKPAEVVTKRIVLPEKEKVEDTKEAPAAEKPAEKPKEVKQEKTKKAEAKKSKKPSKKKTTKKASKKTNKKTRK